MLAGALALAEVDVVVVERRTGQELVDSRAGGRHARTIEVLDQRDATGEPTLRDLSAALVAVYGADYGIHSATSISRSTDMTRQAAAYRDGRILPAGDAAHVHHPWAARVSTPVCRMR